MQEKIFQQQLEAVTLKKLRVQINDNRSTMLSVRWEPDHVRVSLHRMFLQAPQNVMDDLACYINRKTKRMSPEVDRFIKDQLKTLDYSNRIDRTKLEKKGEVYHLEEIYQQINQEYFNEELDLMITWYGNGNRRPRRQINFGLYCSLSRLIKIHRLLDHPIVPEYIIAFVIYHEILHEVCPPYHDEKGVNRIHTPEFKMREKQFRFYALATEWIKKHKELFFNGGIKHGGA